MSEERLERIEALLATLATRDDIAVLRAETKADIAGLRAEIAGALRTEIAGPRAEMATKSEIANVAKNVDIAALGRQLGRIGDDITALKDDFAVTTAMAQRIAHVTSRLIADVLTEIRAEHSRMDRLLNRVQRLESETASGADAG